MSDQVPLRKLLGTCCILAKEAGGIIRHVVEESVEFNIVNKSGLVTNHVNSDTFDPQTIADLRAQYLIWQGLRSVFGKGLRLVGEEGDNDDVGQTESIASDLHDGPLQQSLVKLPYSDGEIEEALTKIGCDIPEKFAMLNEEDMVVWIDPLDGTKEFVKGNYHNVTTLIGISYKGEAIAGVISEPFADKTVCGVVGGGVYEDGKKIVLKKYDGSPAQLIVSSVRFRGTAVELFIMLLRNNVVKDHPIGKGGAGSKYLSMIRGEAEVWLFPRAGCSRWDTCAGDAMIQSLGGKGTSHTGDVYSYDYRSPVAGVTSGSTCHDMASLYANKEGHLVCSNIELHEKILPYSKWVNHLGRMSDTTMMNLFDNEVAWRPSTKGIMGRHSTVFWIYVTVKENDKNRDIPLIVKSVLTSHLEDKPEWKKHRDYTSYKAEEEVYNLHHKGSITIKQMPKVYHSFLNDPNKNHEDFHSLLVLSDLIYEGYNQPGYYSKVKGIAVLKELADLHVNTIAAGKDMWKDTCPFGSYFDPMNTIFQNKWGHNGESFGNAYRRVIESLKESGSDYATPKTVLDSIAESEIRNHFNSDKLDAYYAEANDLIHDAREQLSKYLPLIHGDMKGGNIFIKDDDITDIKLIDWQWAGINLPYFDVVYFIMGAMEMRSETLDIILEDMIDYCHIYQKELLRRLKKENPPAYEAYNDFYNNENGLLWRKVMIGITVLYVATVFANVYANKSVPKWITKNHGDIMRCHHNRDFVYLCRLMNGVHTLSKEYDN